MIINHGGVLRKEYFVSYMNLIRNAMECSIEKARDITFQRLFRNNVKTLGETSYEEFLLAYEELQKSNY
ncbi:hypothetical protein [Sediminibacillus albus]|uniref:Uncharacterized protein n=1 Tax=Sediminibacillus albus TaxID=407036 RepID=A0A1G8YJ63_9BACI|nr:hypothetical protein [Sediminibacillus albus]SDK02882.1 hypothetical protein SAMN05216243_1653 [Sediminibacillus albus]